MRTRRNSSRGLLFVTEQTGGNSVCGQRRIGGEERVTVGGLRENIVNRQRTKENASQGQPDTQRNVPHSCLMMLQMLDFSAGFCAGLATDVCARARCT